MFEGLHSYPRVSIQMKRTKERIHSPIRSCYEYISPSRVRIEETRFSPMISSHYPILKLSPQINPESLKLYENASCLLFSSKQL